MRESADAMQQRGYNRLREVLHGADGSSMSRRAVPKEETALRFV